MARPIVLSNGSLHVGLNKFGMVHDFYYPYVGLENHAAGQDLRHRVGIWIDGRLSWLDDDAVWSTPHSTHYCAIFMSSTCMTRRVKYDYLCIRHLRSVIRVVIPTRRNTYLIVTPSCTTEAHGRLLYLASRMISRLISIRSDCLVSRGAKERIVTPMTAN